MKTTKIISVLAASVLCFINANAVPDLSVGEFAPRDPQANLYTFVANNPVNAIDPFGLQAASGVDENGNNVWWGPYNQTPPGYTFQLTPYNGDLPSGMLWGADRNGNPAPYEMGLQDDPLGNFLLGGIGPALRGSTLRMCPATVAVSRWGRPGLQSGDWVMKGSANSWNYLRSFKWQPGMGNEFAPFDSGATFQVSRSSLQWPSGWGIDGTWKGVFGQRIYVPRTPPVP